MKLPFKAFQPDIELLYKVLRREKTYRPVLFEFIINLEFCLAISGRNKQAEPGTIEYYSMVIEAFRNLGYDVLASRSLNQGALINDRKSFDNYPWPDAGSGNYELYHKLSDYLPDGMKLLGFSNGGVLENAIDIVGFEQLCEMSLTDPELCSEIFKQIGERLITFYSIIASIDSVGVCVVNDDWGFKTQAMFPPEMLKTYVFPYIRKIVEVIHANGKPAILHSCGNVKAIMDVIIDDLKLDGKHSFEDGIFPVEDAWDWWSDRIAIMGGIDVDFLVRRTPEEIYQRSLRLLEKTFGEGGFALGSGNSIPDFVPVENYLAMTRAAVEYNA